LILEATDIAHHVEITQLILWGQEKNGIVLNGTGYYGENRHKHYSEHLAACHAEVDVMEKVSRKHSDKKRKKNKVSYDLVVMRISKHGKRLGMSQLCEFCIRAVNNIKNKSGIKIKKIYYTNEDGNFVQTNPYKMSLLENKHITGYYKNRNYKKHKTNENIT